MTVPKNPRYDLDMASPDLRQSKPGCQCPTCTVSRCLRVVKANYRSDMTIFDTLDAAIDSWLDRECWTEMNYAYLRDEAKRVVETGDLSTLRSALEALRE